MQEPDIGSFVFLKDGDQLKEGFIFGIADNRQYMIRPLCSPRQVLFIPMDSHPEIIPQCKVFGSVRGFVGFAKEFGRGVVVEERHDDHGRIVILESLEHGRHERSKPISICAVEFDGAI